MFCFYFPVAWYILNSKRTDTGEQTK